MQGIAMDKVLKLYLPHYLIDVLLVESLYLIR